MRRLPEVDPTQVGVLGISHGAWVAVEAAREDQGIAFIIPVVGGGIPLWRATLFETHAKLVAKGHDAADVRAGDALLSETFEALREGRAASVPGLIKAAASKSWFSDTPLAPFAGLSDAQITAVAQARWTTELAYDPALALSDLRIPILAIASDRDQAVPGVENLIAISSATRGRADTLLLRDADQFQSIVGVSNFVYAAGLQTNLARWLAGRNIHSALLPSRS